MPKTPEKSPEPKKESAFKKPMKPDAALAKIVGKDSLPRTEVMKKFWDYVKANNLQTPENKRMIKADALLKPLFGEKETISMFEVPGLLGKHLS